MIDDNIGHRITSLVETCNCSTTIPLFSETSTALVLGQFITGTATISSSICTECTNTNSLSLTYTSTKGQIFNIINTQFSNVQCQLPLRINCSGTCSLQIVGLSSFDGEFSFIVTPNSFEFAFSQPPLPIIPQFRIDPTITPRRPLNPCI